MKNKTSFVFVFWWIMLLSLFGIALLFFAEKEERMSEEENRMLSGFPEVSVNSIFSGDFSAGFENYLSDGVFGRNSIISISEDMLRFFSQNTHEDDLLLDSLALSDEVQGNIGDNSGENPEDPTVSGSSVTDAGDDYPVNDSAADEPVTVNISGYGFWLKLRDNGYQNLVSVPEDKIQQVAAHLNNYKKCLPPGGNVFYTNVARTHQALLLHESDTYSGWFENTGEGMAQYLDDGVFYVNSVELLEDSLIDKQPMYFTSDHHWTPRAAIVVVNECKRLQGIPAVPYDDYAYLTKTFENKTKGTSDALELLYPLQKATGYIMTNGRRKDLSPLIGYDYSSYRAFLYGDTRGWVQYETGFSVGRNALVIGDSFSNPFLPYLMPYYDEVNKIDIRHFDPQKMNINVSEMIKTHDIDDIFIVVSHLNGVTGENSYMRLETLLNG